MPAKALVADASVLGALIFQEPRAKEAAELLKGARLFEPALLSYELASIARKKILQFPSDKALILQALELGLALEARWLDIDQAAAVSLALERNITVYDAAYLWTSRLCGAPLATFDKQLQAAAQNLH